MSGAVTNIENILEKTAVIAPFHTANSDNNGGGLIPVDTGHDRAKLKQTHKWKNSVT